MKSYFEQKIEEEIQFLTEYLRRLREAPPQP